MNEDLIVKPVSNETPQISGNAVNCLSSETSCPKKKIDFVFEWLNKHEESTIPNSSPTFQKRGSTRPCRDLDPGDMSESSGSDDAWERLVDGIMTGNNEEAFSSQYSRRVHQKRHPSDLRWVSPLKTEVDFKPCQKNVATVTPYCIHPTASQARRSRASTWSGPTPDVWEGNRALTPSPPPYILDQFNSTLNSPDVDNSKPQNAELSQPGTIRGSK